MDITGTHAFLGKFFILSIILIYKLAPECINN